MIKAKAISAIAKSRFIVMSSIEYASNRRELLDAGRGLIGFARRAYAVRDFGAVLQVSKALSSSPFTDLFQGYGDYYRAIAANKLGTGDPSLPFNLFSRLSEQSTGPLRLRALVGAAHAARSGGRLRLSREYYAEALASSVRDRTFESVPFLQATQGLAIIKSIERQNDEALDILKSGMRFLPGLIRAGCFEAFDYLNSVAVELASKGELAAARRITGFVLASPYAPHHPPWHETRDEIEAMDPAVPTNRVYMPPNMGHLSRNVVEFPQRPPEPIEEEKEEGAELQEVVNKNVIWSQERSLTPALIRQNAEHHLFIRKYQESVDRKEQGGTPDTDGGATGKAG